MLHISGVGMQHALHVNGADMQHVLCANDIALHRRCYIDMLLHVNFVADMFESNPGNLFLSQFYCTW